MKKIKLLISLLLINFCAYSQTIPEVPINQFTQAGYLNSKYYPIGWSEDERYFALMILSESNYASLPEGHGFDFLVKDVITDKDAYIKSYSGYDICEGKFDAYGQGECDFSAKGIFELHKATFTEALNKYNINAKTPLVYSTFPIKNAEGESISIQNYKVEKDGYISMETLTATNDQQGSKTILQSNYDSNFRPLASEIVGAFVSPSKERLLVIQKYTSSGIEGDRDIELNFIGCHTQKGYQFNDVVESKKAEDLVKSKQLSVDSELIENYLKENNIDATKTESGLYYEITKKGTGVNVSARDNVTVHYTAMFLDGEVFDSSLSRNKPLSFDLGRGMVIRGWDEGITYFNKGAEGKLYIPSLLGYGAAGAGGVIPPNAVLIFEIQVLDCGECEDNDKPINSIMEYIGSWDSFISEEIIDLFDAYLVTSKFLTANGFLNEGLLSFLEKIFDTKVFLSGPHYKGINLNSNDFGRFNPEFIKKLITTTEEILSNPVYLNLIRPIYKNHLEDLAFTYQATYELFKLFKTNFPEQLNENTKIYLEAVKTGSFPIEYRRAKDKFGTEGVFVRGIEIPDYDYYKIRGNSSSYYPSLNFWGRRNIDGTNELFSELLGLVIEKIDDDKVDISNAPIKKDRVDISDHAYVIATNVNIRNKPNISESKVLFQLNKVEWIKYQTYPDSAMTNWTSFDPTPVEIIDSTVTDGNKWYKIKGAKLTKKEIDNLSKWDDWDTVRDSLFNLDDVGNKIRQDNSNREHWIYHTLVHRFQNNSFKDGKYSASKVAEASYKKANYENVNDYVNFTIDGYNVKGELGYHPAEMDNITCDIYGYKSADGKHLNLKSTCYSEGDTYEGGTYQITLMDNNAFKLDFTSSRGNFAYNFYRYEFE